MRRRVGIDGPIVVFQMGRVGSASVYQSLVQLKLGVPIYHVHILANIDQLIDSAKKRYADPSRQLEGLENARLVQEELQQDPERPWYVVSLIRDPVRQALSAFFRGLPWLVPDIRDRWEAGDFEARAITALFLEKHNHDVAGQWFEGQLKPVLDIDVLSRPFPTERGFDVFQHGPASLLLLRLEDLDRCFAEAVGEFLGLEKVRLVRVNEAGTAWYAQMYRRFLSEVVLPTSYVEKMYSSRVAEHFYQPEELESFRNQWTQSKESWPSVNSTPASPGEREGR